MKNDERNPGKKQPYVEPKVLVTYKKEELEETIKTQGIIGGSPIDQASVTD